MRVTNPRDWYRPWYYMLNAAGDVVPTSDVRTWAEWFETADRHVAETIVGPYVVSTVFLGLDHSFEAGKPVLWETMIFPLDPKRGDRWLDVDCRRYTSRADALAGHEAMCATVTASLAASRHVRPARRVKR